LEEDEGVMEWRVGYEAYKEAAHTSTTMVVVDGEDDTPW
jgi:hypothetical protein